MCTLASQWGFCSFQEQRSRTYPYLFGDKDEPGKIPTVNLNDNFYNLAGGPYPSHSSGPISTASDSLTKVWGNHTFEFGVYYEYSGENDGDQINVDTVPGGSNNQNGTFAFTDAGTGATSGVSIANLALGYADSYTEIGPRADHLVGLDGGGVRAGFLEGHAQATHRLWRAREYHFGLPSAVGQRGFL